MLLKIQSMIFLHKTTALTHTMHFFSIRRNGFQRNRIRQNGRTP